MKKHDKVLVVTNPMIAANKSAEVTLSKFIRVISAVYPTIQVIGGNISLAGDLNSVDVCSFPIVRVPSKIRRIINLFSLQVKMAKAVMQYGNKDRPVFFWIGDKMILPYLAAKIKQCVINYFIYGNTAKEGNEGVFAKLSSRLIRWMAQNADYTCVESESVYREWPGLTVQNKRVIHLYAEHIEMVPIEKRTNTIGMLCRITPGKHVIESIQAFHKIHKIYPEWRLEIIGSGVQEDECKQLVNAICADNYIFMRGWIDHEEVDKVTSHWKFLLFPTDTEGMPNSVVEMMGKGIPVIASSVGGIKDIVRDGINGWHIFESGVEGIKDAIEKALQEKYSHDIADAAWRTIRDGYSFESACAWAYHELKG